MEALIAKVLDKTPRHSLPPKEGVTFAKHFKYSILVAFSNIALNVLGNFASATLGRWKIEATIVLLTALVATVAVEWRKLRFDR